MPRSNEKTPDTEAPVHAPRTFTSPPGVGTADVWMQVEAEVDALASEEAVAPRVDVQAASEVALSVCGDVRDDAAFYARFKALAATDEVDAKLFSRLQRYAGGAWYARHRQLQAEAGRSFETVPEELVTRGEALFDRMLKLASYHLGDDPEEGAFLASLNGAPGHRKLANGLIGLADVYARHPAVVAADARHYRATDERDARKTAADIIKARSDHATPEYALWTARCARVWTLLSSAHAEAQATGRWLLRATPDVAAARFPSLVAESRNAPNARKTVVDVSAPTPDGAPPVTPMTATPKRRRPR